MTDRIELPLCAYERAEDGTWWHLAADIATIAFGRQDILDALLAARRENERLRDGVARLRQQVVAMATHGNAADWYISREAVLRKIDAALAAPQGDV